MNVDELYEAVFATVKVDRLRALSQTRLRSGVVGGDLASLLVWNILIAGFLHLGCHILGEKICAALRVNEARLGNKEKVAVRDARVLLSQVVEHPSLLVTNVDDQDRSAALGAIKKILVDVGHPEEVAARQAEQVLRVLVGHIPNPRK